MQSQQQHTINYSPLNKTTVSSIHQYEASSMLLTVHAISQEKTTGVPLTNSLYHKQNKRCWLFRDFLYHTEYSQCPLCFIASFNTDLYKHIINIIKKSKGCSC